MEKIWNIEYINDVEINGKHLKSLPRAWDKNKEKLRENKLLKIENDSENDFNTEDFNEMMNMIHVEGFNPEYFYR